MNKKTIWLISLLLALFTGAATAQLPTTTVNDTVYRADGTPAGGSVVINWNAFTTANGSAIPAGSTTVTLATGGMLNVALAPNAGSTPMGNYYTAVYHLNDGTTSREFWVIPVAVPGGGPAKLAGIRNNVLPTSVAMQTVSKQYVDTAISRVQLDTSGSPTGSASGDLTGTYPNPTVAAVHATSGTMSGIQSTNEQLLGVTLNGVGGWASNASQGSMLFSNGTADAPNMTWAYDHHHNISIDTSTVPAVGNCTGQELRFIKDADETTGALLGCMDLSGNLSITGRYNQPLHTPSSSSESCTAGDISDDISFHYVCVATGTWKRASLSSF